MKRMTAQVVLLALAVSLLSGCAGMTREESGAVIGGAVGAIAGSAAGRPAAGGLVLGAALGGVVGSVIGREMDEIDRARTGQVLEYNQTGQGSTWVNPDRRTAYTVVPTRTYETAQGPCREFTTHANIGGKVQEIYGTACRQADGSWQVVKAS